MQKKANVTLLVTLAPFVGLDLCFGLLTETTSMLNIIYTLAPAGLLTSRSGQRNSSPKILACVAVLLHSDLVQSSGSNWWINHLWNLHLH